MIDHLMTHDQSQDPATKQELHTALMNLEERMDKKMDKKLSQSEKRLRKALVHDFKVITEELVKDFNGAHKDKIGQIDDDVKDHKVRIINLESAVGLVA